MGLDLSFSRARTRFSFPSDDLKVPVRDWRTITQNKDALQTLVKNANFDVDPLLMRRVVSLQVFNASNYKGRLSGL